MYVCAMYIESRQIRDQLDSKTCSMGKSKIKFKFSYLLKRKADDRAIR